MSRLLLCSLVLAGFGGVAPAAEPGDEGMVPLFDGKSFAGWKKVGGGATYSIEADEIVGRVGPGSNSFLRTDKTYGDFVLKVDLKLDVPTNSGIQFRSHQQPANEYDGRVYGYQSEVDPLPRAWSGGLYEEGRRTWLYPLEGHPEAQQAFRLDGWNRYTILACGPHLRTWVNGIPCAELLDAMDLEGFIALQVHAGKAGQIRFKNIRLRDLGQSAWKPFWDGTTLTGWSARGGEWKVEDGTIHATQARTQKIGGLLVTDAPARDFAFRFKFKEVKGNIGLHFLTENRDLYWNHTRSEKPQEPATKKSAPKAVEPKDGWNVLAAIAIGDRFVLQLNGLTVVDDRAVPGARPGRIEIELQGGQETDVAIKDLEILPVDEDRCR